MKKIYFLEKNRPGVGSDLNEGQKYCSLLQNAPLGAFCNTFDLH